MPRLLENKDSHALVQNDDGEVDLVPWSDQNKLIYEHGLDGVIDTGEETLVLPATDSFGKISLTPHESATEFTLTVDGDDVPVPQHEKSELIDVLADAYDDAHVDDGPYRGPIVGFASRLMDVDVSPAVVNQLADVPPFDGSVAVQDSGWLINDHVLLTFDNEFYHPGTTSKDRNGGVVDANANKNAYKLEYQGHDADVGQSVLDDFGLANGGQEEHVDFVARALWAVTYASPEDPRVVDQ